MEELIRPFYSVMHKYRKSFSEFGVKANLEKWAANKAGLLNMLRHHKNWVEESKAVVFNVTEGREIDGSTVNLCRDALLRLSQERLDGVQQTSFRQTLELVIEGYGSTLPDTNIESIKASGIKCAAGQKTSRVVNRLCVHFGLEQHEGYNAAFAKMADALSPLSMEKKAVLSLHPCDYLEMSNKDSSWSSCHGLQGGGYQAGCLSYMNDATTMIFYTVDNGVAEEYWKAPKRSRQVFCYSNGLLLQSRLYPNDDDEPAIRLYRKAVQSVITDCLSVPNRWKLKRQDFHAQILTAEESRNYRDYGSYGSLSILKVSEGKGSIFIGEHALCVCCGKVLSSNGDIKCRCENKVVCRDCGQTVTTDRARYHGGYWYCDSCLHECAICHDFFPEPLVIVFDGRGGTIEMCAACAERRTAPCEGCNIHAACSTISGNRFCPRMAELPDAA